jgi:hypothetical protein
MASLAARSRWPSARASSPVIHRERPRASAMRPSSELATFQVMRGRPVACTCR